MWSLSSEVFVSVKSRIVTLSHTMLSVKIVLIFRTQILHLQGNDEGGKLFRNARTHLANCEVP